MKRAETPRAATLGSALVVTDGRDIKGRTYRTDVKMATSGASFMTAARLEPDN